MNNKIIANNLEYWLIKNYREAFNEEEFINKCTDYFINYDYIVGDIAYGKLRLKGFYDSKNKKAKKLNNYDNLEDYELIGECNNNLLLTIYKKDEYLSYEEFI